MSEGDKVVKELGEGGQGSVELVKRNGQYLARKKINVKEKGIANSRREVKILKKMRDRYVVIYKDYYHDKENDLFYIYTEYFKNRDLRNIIKHRNHEDFEIPLIVKYMKNLVCVMQYIHGENIIHRDLKPSNIFVTENNELIIGDFGLAIEKDKSDHQFAGTRNYIAPEIYDNERDPPYSEASDIFSLGCIFYEIYTLRKLYDGIDNDEIKNKILNDREIHFERNGMKISDIEKLIIRMINKNPEKRIKLHDIIARMKIIEEDLDILSESDPIIANISSYASSSTTATTSNTFDHHHNLTVGFYLYGDTVEGMTLKEMSSVNQNDFNKKWKSRYVDILFPVVGQDNPSFTPENSILLRDRKNVYKEDLQRLLYLIRNSPNYMSSGISNSIDLFLDVVELPDLKYNPDEEQRIRTEFFSLFGNVLSFAVQTANQ